VADYGPRAAGRAAGAEALRVTTGREVVENDDCNLVETRMKLTVVRGRGQNLNSTAHQRKGFIMRRQIQFVMTVLALLLVLGTPSVLALTSYANVRADFYMYGGRNYEGAEGYAIFNWVKGQGKWNVSGEVWGTRPDTYTLSVGTGGTCAGNVEIVDFTVDESGYASFSAQVDNLPVEYNIARIYKQGLACNTELTAPESEGLLKARGINRTKTDNGNYHY
jgi:hypothetical protein